MKKAWILIFVLVLTLGLCACKQTQVPVAQEFTFAPGTTVLNVDISGLRKEDAWTKLSTAAIGYELQLTVDGVTVPVTAQEIDLVCSEEAFMAGAAALEAGSAADFSNVVSFNEGKLREILSRNFNKDVTEAAITFDEAAKQFVLVPHADGQKSNPNELVSQAKDAICKLLPQYTLSGVSEILHPVRSSDDPQVQEASSVRQIQAAYVIKEGDTLADICSRYYGNLDHLEEICEVNEITDANKIMPGQKIVLP